MKHFLKYAFWYIVIFGGALLLVGKIMIWSFGTSARADTPELWGYDQVGMQRLVDDIQGTVDPITAQILKHRHHAHRNHVVAIDDKVDAIEIAQYIVMPKKEIYVGR